MKKNSIETHGLDTEKQIFFYEHEYYIFSNFSSFAIEWFGKIYPTSEHAYHAQKFTDPHLRELIRTSRSAHDALKLAHKNRDKYRKDWDAIKVRVMYEIIRVKALQHPYVMKKLLESGDRKLIENSWRDSFWGWGEDGKGQNIMGELWMDLREEFKKKRKQ